MNALAQEEPDTGSVLFRASRLPLLIARQFGLALTPEGDPDPDVAVEWADLANSAATVAPSELATLARRVEVTRTFGFIDICGFTSFTDDHGAEHAIAALAEFRALVRLVAGKRGVRVMKWLGDGVLLVGVEASPLVATCVDIVARSEQSRTGLRVRAGVASGTALFFDGDDYVGRPVNLAARLCDIAKPASVLASFSEVEPIPEWISVSPVKPFEVSGIGRVAGVVDLAANDPSGVPAPPTLPLS